MASVSEIRKENIMDSNKAIEISKKLESMADEIHQLMTDEGFQNDHVTLTVNKQGYITIRFEDYETSKAGTDATYVTKCTNVLER